MEDKLTIDQLAKVLGISRRTIERELEKPDCNIPYNKIGKRKFFLLSEVIYSTKVAPVDKNEVIKRLESIIETECLFPDFQEGLCVKGGVEDIIRFIKGEK